MGNGPLDPLEENINLSNYFYPNLCEEMFSIFEWNIMLLKVVDLVFGLYFGGTLLLVELKECPFYLNPKQKRGTQQVLVLVSDHHFI
jgi:hypothetical protein